MPLAQTHYSLKNLRANLASGLAVNAISIDIERNLIYAPKKPGQTLVPQQVYMGENLPKITLVTYFDDVCNIKDILPNQAITSFDIISPLDTDESIFAAEFFAKFPPSSMVFGAPKTQLNGDNPATITFDIQCNVLNPGADGGYPTDAPEDETP